MKRPTFLPAAMDWRWPFSWYVKENQQPDFELWMTWHYHCLLPRTHA